MKNKDIEKIAHYACLVWCFSSGEVIKNEMVGEHQTGGEDLPKGSESTK